MLNKFQSSTCSFKILHKTGAPTKRKMEIRYRAVNAKVRKLEEGLSNTQSKLSACQKNIDEKQRTIYRLLDPNKKPCSSIIKDS